MHILMVGNDRTVLGGITSVVDQILEHDWEKDGVEIEYLPTYKGGNALNKICFFMLAVVRFLYRIMRKRPDIVYYHMSHHGSFDRKFFLHRICKKFSLPDVIHLHGSEFQSWYDECTIEKQKQICLFLRECGAIIVLGEKWYDTVKEIEPQANIVIINNTVKIATETVVWDDACFKILFLGVLIKRKGVSDLLRAFRILKDQRDLTHVQCVIGGTGEEMENLIRLAEELGIREYIDFLGWIDGAQKEMALKNSQILVLPSYNEGLPIAVLEGMSYGMPIIATNVGDMAEAVHDKVNGYLIEPGNITQLAECLLKMLDKERYMEFSRASKRIAVEKFSDESYFRNIHRVFSVVLKNKRVSL